MQKKYIVNVSLYQVEDGTGNSEEPVYAEHLHEFRTEFGAMAFLKRITRKFKTVW